MKKLTLFLAALALSLCCTFAQTTQTLNKKNLVIKEWNTDVQTNKKFLDHVTTYNADGRKIEEIEYTSSGQKWRKRYEYDAAGRMTLESVYDDKNKLDNYKKFEYNELNRKKTQYTYTPKGKLQTVKVYEYLAEDT
ncbi:MAG: hypothetical protein VZQ75_10195 [Candidatus Faecousia sp.]|nr:hypothetical protein [Candidatus Faecousia sp.]